MSEKQCTINVCTLGEKMFPMLAHLFPAADYWTDWQLFAVYEGIKILVKYDTIQIEFTADAEGMTVYNRLPSKDADADLIAESFYRHYVSTGVFDDAAAAITSECKCQLSSD